MKRPPMMIEYICLTCGAQGLGQTDSPEPTIPMDEGGCILRCPKCGAGAFFLKKRTTSHTLPAVHAKTT